MPELLRRRRLSPHLNQLKRDIHILNNEENVSIVKDIHQKSTVLERISGSVSKFFVFLAAILTSQRTIPVIGSIAQILALIPKSLAIITHPKKSTSEKVFASVFLGTIIILSTTATILGATAAVFLGVAVSAVVTVVEGITLVSQLFEKYNTAKAYNKKLQFNELIEKRTIPEGDEFNELFEIRFVELTHKIANERLNKEVKSKLAAECQFIAKLLKNKNIKTDAFDKKASLLATLYKNREQLFHTLIHTLSAITPESPLTHHVNEIRDLQNQISVIDSEIISITAPIEKLDLDNMMASEKLALATTTFSMVSAGTLLSIISLLLMLGGVAMPPAIVPIIVGFGIGLAALSLIKFIVEKYDEYQDKKEQEQSQKDHEDGVLDEALYRCDLGTNPVANSSHAQYMQGLITSPAVPPVKNTPGDKEAPHFSGALFSKPTPAMIETTSSKEAKESKVPPT